MAKIIRDWATGREIGRKLIGQEVGRGNAGTSAVVAPGNQMVLVDVGGADDEEAQAMLVSVASEAPLDQPAPSGKIVRPTMLVEWGTGGFGPSAEIDATFGTQFSVFGSRIRVTGRNPLIPPGSAINGVALVQGSAKLGACLAYGTSQRFAPLTLTKYIDDPGLSAGPVTLLVPAYATSLLIVTRPDTATVTATWLDGMGNNTGSTIRPGSATNQNPLFMQIPGGTVAVQLSGVGALIVRAVFGISI